LTHARKLAASFALAFAVLFAGGTFIGCEKSAGDKAGDAVEKAVDKTSDAADKVVDKTKDAADKVTPK
jgi:hypothetical protein